MVPIRVILGLYWGYMGDNGKENGNYYSILGSYLGGCQNYGPFLGTLNIRCRIIIGIKKGPIVLTTTHMV